MSPEAWNLISAIAGGVIGALAGGIPALLLARRESKQILERDREARVERQKAAGHRVFVKLLTITNSVHEIHTYIEDKISRAASRGDAHMETWQIVEPLVGFGDEGAIHFDAEEAGLFIAAREGQYLMDLLLLDRRHAGLVAGMKEYTRLRLEHRATAPLPDRIEGTKASSLLSGEERMRQMLHAIPLQALITGLRDNAAKDWELAASTANRFGPILQKYFNDPKFRGLTFSAESTMEPAASPTQPAATGG